MAASDSDAGANDIHVSLEGGVYRLDSPLGFPGHAKGFGLVDGALQAGPSFPADRYLIEVLPVHGEGTPTELSFTNLVLDAAHRGGCFRSDAVVQLTLQQIFFLHFASAGILGSSEFGMGHELMISKCFFAEFMWGEPGFDDKARKTGTGVNLTYPDSHVIDSILRCSRVGVHNQGGSNLMQGLHIYTTCNHGADAANMTDGLVLAGSQQRFVDGYIDTCTARVTTVGGGSSIENTLFFGEAGLVLDPKRWGPSSDFSSVQGLIVTDNHFTCAAAPWGQACGNMTIANSEGVRMLPTEIRTSVIANNNWQDAANAKTTRPAGRAFVNSTLKELAGTGMVVNVTLDQRFALPLALGNLEPGAVLPLGTGASPLRRVFASASSPTQVSGSVCGNTVALVATPLSVAADGSSIQVHVFKTCGDAGQPSAEVAVGVYVQADQST